MSDRAPITSQIAAFAATMAPDRPPPPVRDYARRVVFDGIGVLVTAGHRAVTASSGIGAFVERHGGAGPATLIARGRKGDAVSAALANGTLGYAADFEPHHPAAILHAVAVMVPTALAISELRGGTGAEMVAAVVLGCEITCRVSMALNPRELYDLASIPRPWPGLSARRRPRLGCSGSTRSNACAPLGPPRFRPRGFWPGRTTRARMPGPSRWGWPRATASRRRCCHSRGSAHQRRHLAGATRRAALKRSAWELPEAPGLTDLAALLAEKPTG